MPHKCQGHLRAIFFHIVYYFQRPIELQFILLSLLPFKVNKSLIVYYGVYRGWANSALRYICLSEMLSRAHVVDSFLSLLFMMAILFLRDVIIKCK